MNSIKAYRGVRSILFYFCNLIRREIFSEIGIRI